MAIASFPRGREGRRARARRGFTLIELLVVIAIIALLITILMPTLSRVWEMARRARCGTNLHNMGTGWHQLWAENGRRFPGISIAPNDNKSQDNYCVVMNHQFVNTGVLYKNGFLEPAKAYICPTIHRSIARPWFDDANGSFLPNYPNPWPPNSLPWYHRTRMTYGTRRMDNYDDSSLAGPGAQNQDIQLRKIPLSRIRNPKGFSFMADCFNMPFTAELSHVPGVQVLNLGGNVHFFTDNTPDGSILYNNGIPLMGNSTAYNWIHDDIWMVIDGYHQPPVGP